MKRETRWLAGRGRAWAFVALLAPAACGPDLPEPDLSSAEPGIVDAVRAAEAAVEASPASAEAWGRLGDRYRAHGWADEALACYRKALELEPQAFVWPYLIADILSLNDPVASVEYFEKAVALDAAYPPAHVRYGIVLARMGRSDEARAHYRTALSLDPELAHAWLGLGQLEIAAGRFAEARENLQRAISFYPSLDEAHRALAQALVALGDKEGAERHAAMARTLPSTLVPDPRQARPVDIAGSRDYNQRGEELLARGEREAAIEHFREALRNNPDHFLAHKNMGLALMEKGDHQAAEGHLRQALEKNPGLTRAQMALGIILAQRGEYASAETHLRQAVALTPRAAEPYYNLGTLLGKTGRLDEAVETFRQAIAIDSWHMAARANLALALSAAGRHDEAEAAVREALALVPNEPKLTQILGEVTASRKRSAPG